MIRLIDSLPTKETGLGASEHEIAEAEKSLGVRFPPSYKAFLSRFGWLRVGYDALYGVGPSVPPTYELVRSTFRERNTLEPNIPVNLVPFLNDGAGNHYCLDTANLRGDECPVVFWDHEHIDGSDQIPELVSPSFDQWLIDYARDFDTAED